MIGGMMQTYGLAVACYIPWIPFFLKQSASVQGGFWIGPVNYNGTYGKEPHGDKSGLVLVRFSEGEGNNDIYDSAEHPVAFYRDWSEYEYGSLEPVREYHHNLFDNLDEWLSEHLPAPDLPTKKTNSCGSM